MAKGALRALCLHLSRRSSELKADNPTIQDLRAIRLPQLLARMQACADRSLEIEEWSCLTWVYGLQTLFTSPTFDLPPNLFPHDLVHTLKQCRDRLPAPDDHDLERIILQRLEEQSQQLLRPEILRPLAKPQKGHSPSAASCSSHTPSSRLSSPADTVCSISILSRTHDDVALRPPITASSIVRHLEERDQEELPGGVVEEETFSSYPHEVLSILEASTSNRIEPSETNEGAHAVEGAASARIGPHVLPEPSHLHLHRVASGAADVVLPSDISSIRALPQS